jgi:hypothetical protein
MEKITLSSVNALCWWALKNTIALLLMECVLTLAEYVYTIISRECYT